MSNKGNTTTQSIPIFNKTYTKSIDITLYKLYINFILGNFRFRLILSIGIISKKRASEIDQKLLNIIQHRLHCKYNEVFQYTDWFQKKFLSTYIKALHQHYKNTPCRSDRYVNPFPIRITGLQLYIKELPCCIDSFLTNTL